MPDTITTGLVPIGGHASDGIYPDEDIPSFRARPVKVVRDPVRFVETLTSGRQAEIEAALRKMADGDRCDLVFTTDGTGPVFYDAIPGATPNVVEEEMPGFGE